MDLAARTIRVARSLDDEGDIIATKTEAGEREIPILAVLMPVLVDHGLSTQRTSDDLVFGRTAREPYIPSTVRRRAIDAGDAAGLQPIALHECRHTAATEMRAAGLDFKLISRSSPLKRHDHVRPIHARGAGLRSSKGRRP